MEFATGALGALLPKLANLLHGEYKLHKNMRKDIEFLAKELETTQAALRTVGEVPTEQLPELVRIWARDARELSYNMEDVVDNFLVHVEGPDPPSKRNVISFVQKMVKSMRTMGKHREISEQIEDIKKRAVELAARRDRYKVDTVNRVTPLDPRIKALHVKITELVGIDEGRKEMILKLTKKDDMSSQQEKIVSIVGIGGLGKTTLAKAVYDEIKSQFDCTAFVTISQNPDMKKFFKDMLYKLDQQKYGDIHNRSLDVEHLINEVKVFISNKRYFIVIDDIWEISNWDIIKCSLPDDITGCRVVTTTRKLKVAKHIGGDHKMKSLSSSNSRVLLHRRIFGNDVPEKYMDAELGEVSNRILKKCAGVPLAIITIASLLASKGRNKTEWDEVYNSMGTGMENSLDTENMRKILSYSYYDLPSHLRTCLLYLSMFPEDFKIKKDRLIWLWIAEGFIQGERQWKKSLFELGESYLNELINRSLIQPGEIHHYNEVYSIQVHDMVLDLVRSISSEGNFVTLWNNLDQTSPSTMARRLSLQNGKTDHALTQATSSMVQVRSIIVFPSALDQMPALGSFKVLRVLDLQRCDLSENHYLRHLGTLFHLRYLNLEVTRIYQLPESIGSLQFLEVLNLQYNRVDALPKCVAKLTHLLCLSVPRRTKIPSLIGSLTSLNHLSWLTIDDDSTDTVEVLGLLTELRVLRISLETNKLRDKLVESVCKLRKIQTLQIDNWMDHYVMCRLGAWVASQQLRHFHVNQFCWFSVLPLRMNNPTQFPDLVLLCINVRELQQEDLEILGRLPALRNLQLEVDHKDLGIVGRRFVVGAGSFPCLRKCWLWRFVVPIMFQQGAMPRLTLLGFDFDLGATSKIAGSDGGFNLGLQNLQSLKKVYILIVSGGASVEAVEEAKDALRHAAEIHPNPLQLKIRMFNRGLDR